MKSRSVCECVIVAILLSFCPGVVHGGVINGKVFDLNINPLTDKPEEVVTIRVFQVNKDNIPFGDSVVAKSKNGEFTVALPDNFKTITMQFTRFDARVNTDRVTRTITGLIGDLPLPQSILVTVPAPSQVYPDTICCRPCEVYRPRSLCIFRR
jgi:hypothetical protein